MEKDTDQTLEPRFLRVAEAARVLHLPLATVYDKCAKREIASTRLGATILIPIAAIHALERKALGESD